MEKTVVEGKPTLSSKKSIIGNIMLLSINIALVAYIFISYFASGEALNLRDLADVKINYIYIVGCFILLAIVLFLDTLRYHRLIYNVSGIKSARVSYLVSAYGKYYDYVTPFGSGGQPFQIYFLHKSNLDGDASVSVPISRFLLNHISLLIFFLFSLIYCLITSSMDFNLVFTLSVLAFIGNLIFILFIIFVSLKKDLCYKICIFFLNVLNKIKLVKNYEQKVEKLNVVLNKYQKNLKNICKNKKEFVIQILLGLLTIILNYAFVYLIYLAFKINFVNEVSFMDIITSMVVCEMISSVMPLPGGTGAAEFSFISLFSKWFSFGNGKNIVVWVMLIWRLFTFYFYILQGFFITIKDTLKGGIKKDKRFIKKT